MRRIIYQSVAGPDMDRAALFRLVYHARVANEARGLSGFLLFADGRFLQVLEGDTWKLCATFARIRQDVRHSSVEVIDERSVLAPAFAKWRMRCFDEDAVDAALEAIAVETGGMIPKPVEQAVLAFFGCETARADLVTMQEV